jgi:3-oxoacyl-[acyl-carrier protein] reductase
MTDFLHRIGLQDKAAIVIGGGQGIGRACSLFLAEAGAHIVVMDKDAPRAQSVAGEIKALGRKSLAIVGDVSDVALVDRVVTATLSEFGRIDVLVNDVAQTTWSASEDMSEEKWDSDILRSLKYVWRYSKAVANVMMKQQRKGSIVSIGSISGLTAAPWHSAYGVAKAGVSSLTRTLAVEWGTHGIRVNCVAPGSIYTPRIEQLIGEHPELVEQQRQRIPIGRWGTPDDIAGAVVFLASDLCPYITGQTIVVDGAFLFNQLQTMGT